MRSVTYTLADLTKVHLEKSITATRESEAKYIWLKPRGLLEYYDKDKVNVIITRRKAKNLFKKDAEFPNEEAEYRLSNCKLYFAAFSRNLRLNSLPPGTRASRFVRPTCQADVSIPGLCLGHLEPETDISVCIRSVYYSLAKIPYLGRRMVCLAEH